MIVSLLIPLEVYPWNNLQACTLEFSGAVRLSKGPNQQARVEANGDELLAEFLNRALESAVRDGEL